MLTAIISTIIFYILLIVYLKRKKQNSLLFCILFSILNIFSIVNPYVSAYGDRYSISFMVCFVLAIIFNTKELIILGVATLIGLVIDGKNLIYKYYIVLDLVINIFSMFFGYYLSKVLYRKNKIHPFSSIIYATAISSLYSVIYLTFYSVFEVNIEGKFDLTYYIYVVLFVVQLFFALLIVYLLEDKNIDEKDSLVYIFVKRFRVLLIILFFITMFINNRLFSFFIINKNCEVINSSFESAVSAIDEIEKKYGEKSLYYSNEAKAYVSGWDTDASGAVYFLDEEFNLINVFFNYEKKEKKFDYAMAKGFKDIVNCEKEIIVKYNNNGNEVYAKYTKYKNYYIIAFIPEIEIEKNIIVISYLTSYAMIITMLAIFMLLFYSVNKNVVSRVQKTNKKLKKISKGDYNVMFNDTSSKELKELSEHINGTVRTLKNNIKEVEEKNKQELELAKKIQESQLRMDDIEHIAFDVNGQNIPAEEVGGDFYDYFYIDYGHVIFLIADVSGKGIPGAMFMIKAKNAIINFAKQKLPLEEIVKRTNESLCQNNDTMMFVTCFMGILSLRTGVLRYISCGHNAPIISIKNSNGYEVSYLETIQQRILGIDSDTVYKAEDIVLKEGDKITLYTDGVTEARNENKDFYGEDRLIKNYKDICILPPKDINEKIIGSVKEFSIDTVQFDDITLLTLLYKNTKNEIKLNAVNEDINVGKEYLNKFIKLYDMPIDVERNLKIVYDEIFSNIKNYAYDNKGGELIFKVNLVDKSTIEMVFMDKGPEFNPIDYKNEKTEKNVEDKVDGGMGLMFCKNIMDKMQYERKDDYNIFSLYKKFE